MNSNNIKNKKISENFDNNIENMTSQNKINNDLESTNSDLEKLSKSIDDAVDEQKLDKRKRKLLKQESLKIKDDIKKIYIKLIHKYRVSKGIYISVNLIIIFSNVISSILNIRAINETSNIKGDFQNQPLMFLFFTIAIINVLIILIVSISTIMNFTNKMQSQKARIKKLQTMIGKLKIEILLNKTEENLRPELKIQEMQKEICDISNESI